MWIWFCRCLLVLVAILAIGFVVFPLGIPQLTHYQPPALTVNERGHFVLTEPWSFEVDGKTFTIPKGNQSNGITADPWVEEWAGGEGVDKGVTHAAIVHDWLILKTSVNRFRADKIFYAAMRQGDVPWWKAKVMTFAVMGRSFKLWRRNLRHNGANAPQWRQD